MAELQRASVTGGGLYERLLQRLALALDEADTAERLRDEHPTELELRGLSEAEMGPPAPRRHVSLKQRQLLCALCGAPVQWSKGHGVLPCGHCGSQLFRSGNDR